MGVKKIDFTSCVVFTKSTSPFSNRRYYWLFIETQRILRTFIEVWVVEVRGQNKTMTADGPGRGKQTVD